MNIFGSYGMGYGTAFGTGMSFVFVLLLWSLFWKGLALWHSSRRGEYWWFVIMLVINTVGILEIVYLFAIAGIKPHGLFTMGGKAEDKPLA